MRSKKSADLSRFERRKGSDGASIYSTTETISGLSNIPEDKPGSGGKPDEPSIPRNKSNETITQTNLDDVGGKKVGSKAAAERPKTPDQSEQGDALKPDTPTAAQTTPQAPAPTAGWLDWLSRTPFAETQVGPTSDTTVTANDNAKEADEARPATPPAHKEPEAGPTDETLPDAPAPASSWFGYWYSSGQPVSKPEEEQPDTPREPNTDDKPEDTDVTMSDAPPPSEQPEHKHESPPTAGSTWAFWARDSPKGKDAEPKPESGEIAVIGEECEAHPKTMAECDVSPTKDAKEDTKTKDVPKATKSTWRKSKRLRPSSMEIDSHSRTPSGASTPLNQEPQESNQPPEAPTKVIDSSSKSIAESEVASKTSPNLLLPSFSSTYQMKENPSIIKQVTQFLLRTEQKPVNHVFRLKDPPKIRKAIAIGIHGLFPATYLRAMIGQPTGTSLRFASLGADAIRRWAEAHGCGDCEIEKVALEGEGKINERVDNLWKLMLNWIDHIRSADLILIACHSQGVPVSIMLLEKLIDLGVITNAKVGVCAMAGVSMGPFSDYKSGLLMGSAAELWDFGNPESDHSKRFEAALKHALDYGVRITFIGSIDDQVVPMEVSSPYSQPQNYDL